MAPGLVYLLLYIFLKEIYFLIFIYLLRWETKQNETQKIAEILRRLIFGCKKKKMKEFSLRYESARSIALMRSTTNKTREEKTLRLF